MGGKRGAGPAGHGDPVLGQLSSHFYDTWDAQLADALIHQGRSGFSWYHGLAWATSHYLGIDAEGKGRDDDDGPGAPGSSAPERRPDPGRRS